MSWLGNSFNSLTGQITNFTREVLTEGTEEVNDYVAELNLSRKQVQELTAQCQSLRTEVERMRLLNIEQEERSQAAEIHIQNITCEHRNISEKKEIELKQLKQQQNKLEEHYRQNITSRTEDSAPSSHSPNQYDNRSYFYQSDELDFGDVIDSQHEINKLSAEVVRLRSERDWWKSKSSPQSQPVQQNDEAVADDCKPDTPDDVDFHARIKELEDKLYSEVDEHQHELSTLQDFHTQKYAKLKEQYETEVSEKLQRGKGHEGASSARDDELEIQRLNEELGKYILENKEKDEKLSLLSSRVEEITNEKLQSKEGEVNDASIEDLIAEKDDLRSAVSALQERTSSLELANRALVSDLEEFDMQHETAMIQLKTDKDELSNANEILLVQLETAKNNLEDELIDENRRLEEELDSLRAQINVESEDRSSKLEVAEEIIRISKDFAGLFDQNTSQQSAADANLDLHPQFVVDAINSLKDGKKVVEEKLAKLNAEVCEKDSKIRELEILFEKEGQKNEENRATDAEVIDGDSRLKDLETENARLSDEVKSKQSIVESLDSETKEKLRAVENELEEARSEMESLRQADIGHTSEIDELVVEISELRGKLKDSDEVCNELKKDETLLRRKNEKLQSDNDLLLERRDSDVQHFEGRIEESEKEIAEKEVSELGDELSRDLDAKSVEISNLREMLQLRDDKIESLLAENISPDVDGQMVDASVQCSIDPKPETELINKMQISGSISQGSDESSGGSDFEIVQKDDGSDKSSSSKEFEQVEGKEVDEIGDELSLLLTQKDKEIKVLQEKVLYLSKQLLDSQPPSEVLPNSQSVEQQWQRMEFEKEQVISILNEKTRECSSLKAEVHQLMGVVSAEKCALNKLQEDNKRLFDERNELADPGLRKEAIENLSRLVRDRDMEIEALNEKNQSLSIVLGEQTDFSDRVDNLLKDKAELIKQINIYKNDREEILDTLNQKHRESISYHTEVERLQTILTEEAEKYDDLNEQHRSISEQFEAKQKSLVNTQNELISVVQRLAFIEREQAELKAEHELMLKRDDGNETCPTDESSQRRLKDKDTIIDRVKIDELTAMLKTEVEDREQLKSQCRDYHALVERLRDELDQQRRAYEKQFEMLAQQESNLNQVLQRKSDDEAVSKNECRELRQQLASIRLERDQLSTNLIRGLEQNEDLRSEILSCKDTEQKLCNELDRLRRHLIQIEETYTREALQSEEREKELINKLAVVDDFDATSRESDEVINRLHEQLDTVTQQRDDAYEQLSNAEDQIQQYSASLSNLQIVLEQFQQEKERDIKNVVKRLEAVIQDENAKVKDLGKEIDLREEKLNEAKEAIAAASRLSEQLDKKEDTIDVLKSEVEKKDKEVQKYSKEMQDYASNSNSRVDKQIMKNLILGYFGAPQDKKLDVMRLLAGVLDFNQQEVAKVGLHKSHKDKNSGWLSWMSPTTMSSETALNNSLSEAFIEFLQQESQPHIQVKLPAEEMAKEMTSKSRGSVSDTPHVKPLRINPFTASLDQPLSSPPTEKVPPSGSQSSQLLMKPVMATLPTFTPLPVSESSQTSSNILKSVLKEQ